jgi:hypothetical protein
MPEFFHSAGKRWGCALGAGLLLAGVAGCADPSGVRTSEPTQKAEKAKLSPMPRKTVDEITQLSQWFMSVSSDYTKLENDLDAMAQDPSTGKCAVLLDDIHALQKNPIPDDNAELSGYWNRGIGYYELAFAECKEGDFTSSSLDLDKGTDQLSKANDLIGSLYL